MRNSDPTFGDIADLRNKMLKWARKLTRGGHAAEDLVQDAILRMYANKHRFDASFGGVDQWARVVLLNVWRGAGRSASRAQMVPLLDDMFAAPDNPFTAVYCRQVCAFLGFDAAMLLADPETPMSSTTRSQRRRLRTDLELRAAA